MKTTCILASLIAGAAAFAPAQQKASSTALKSYENEAGVIAPAFYFGKKSKEKVFR